MKVMTLRWTRYCGTVALVAILPLSLAACAIDNGAMSNPEESTSQDQNWSKTPSQADLAGLQQAAQGALDDDGREFYGSVGGVGDGEATIEIALERDGLAIVGACVGADDTATVRIDDEDLVDLPCSDDIVTQDLIDSLDLQGRELRIVVGHVPAGATWSVMATNAATGDPSM